MDMKALHPLEGKVVILEYLKGDSVRDRVGSIGLPYLFEEGELIPLMEVGTFPKMLEEWNTDSLHNRVTRFLRYKKVNVLYVPTWAPHVCGVVLGRFSDDIQGNRWHEVDTLNVGDWRLIRFALDGFTICWFNTEEGYILPD